jgi:hypothetical protein
MSQPPASAAAAAGAGPAAAASDAATIPPHDVKVQAPAKSQVRLADLLKAAGFDPHHSTANPLKSHEALKVLLCGEHQRAVNELSDDDTEALAAALAVPQVEEMMTLAAADSKEPPMSVFGMAALCSPRLGYHFLLKAFTDLTAPFDREPDLGKIEALMKPDDLLTAMLLYCVNKQELLRGLRASGEPLTPCVFANAVAWRVHEVHLYEVQEFAGLSLDGKPARGRAVDILFLTAMALLNDRWAERPDPDKVDDVSDFDDSFATMVTDQLDVILTIASVMSTRGVVGSSQDARIAALTMLWTIKSESDRHSRSWCDTQSALLDFVFRLYGYDAVGGARLIESVHNGLRIDRVKP